MERRARIAVRLDTFSSVIKRSDTTGAVELKGLQAVGVELVELAAVVVDEDEDEEEARRRRGRVCAASQAPHPPPLLAAAARRMVEAGQVVAVLPRSAADTDWLAKSEVRKPDTCTSAITTPWDPRAEVMSQRRPW